MTLLFREYNAGAHPANRERLGQWNNGMVRGEQLAQKLEQQGYEHNPTPGWPDNTRAFLEVYPHPAMVTIFGLDKVIPYKNKPNRKHEDRIRAFKQYQQHLASLEHAKPALSLPQEILEANVHSMTQSQLKNYEDTLDAIFCAYTAQYAHARPQDCTVLGSLQEGYIMTPIGPREKTRLKEIESQKTLAGFTSRTHT